MAMTEMQQPSDKADFYRTLRGRASAFYDAVNILQRTSEFLNLMDATTLNNMGVPASGADEGLRQDLVNFRLVCNELIGFYNGTSTTRTNVPLTVVNKIRHM